MAENTEVGAKFEGDNVPIKFFTTSFDREMPETTFYIPAKVTMEALSEFVNTALKLRPPVTFNFLHKNEFLRYPILDKWMKRKGINKETTLELEYTPAFEVEAGNNMPHDDWVSCIKRLPLPETCVPESSLHPYLTGSYDKCIRIWRGQECLVVGGGHSSAIKSASIIGATEGAIVAGNKRKRDTVECTFATGSKDGTVRIWKYAGGSIVEQGKFDHPQSVDTIEVHPDGGSLICSGGWDKILRIWALDKANEESFSGASEYLHAGMPGHSRGILASAWSRTNRAGVYSTGLDGHVRVWDVKQVHNIATLSAHSSAAYCMSVTEAQGADSILTGHSDNKVRRWDPRQPEQCSAYTGHKGFVYGVEWNTISNSSQDMKFSSVSEDGTLSIWDARGSTPLATLSPHTDGILCVEYLGDGIILTGSKDQSVRSVNLSSSAKQGK